MISKVPRVLTIAGSDSGGGAGIQADLKTIAALGGHGMSALTSLTSQNTREVTKIVDLDPEFVAEQIRVCLNDIGVDAVKTGMLHTAGIIQVVSRELSKIEAPKVVDPVMVAKSGAQLLQPAAVDELKKSLFPLATVITPNASEATVLSGLRIEGEEDQRKVAETLSREFGVPAVVVKGGHLHGDRVIDILYFDGSFYRFEVPRIHTRATHGTGCVFASAIATQLAKGAKIPEAVKEAQNFVYEAIRGGFLVGQGSGPVNPMSSIVKKAGLLDALKNLREAVRMIEEAEYGGHLAPESGINIGEAPLGATGREDVVAVPGRIVRVFDRLKATTHPWMGGSRHVADAILTILQYDHSRRAAMNLKFSEDLLDVAEELGFTISSYDRSQEPPEIKSVEGMTIRWGVARAYEATGKVTDIIFHRGDWGKEPIIMITGRNSLEVAEKFLLLLGKYLEKLGRKP
ncbi:MAG: bifunctional hydroxymethylpyrimidine kinase/phosphomethylpyrimidine kinase [Nitrososphaerota archaeon]|nr:bifunctional hydroxymethylpyrimidine kinase/phosphomethylpyrimidine kinase [Candidatus Calditenuaceae archaeon]MDW8073074.1 bifunctional hydroxymethylpyrimidine kinase/phosphomethylpyrimidine kinase [Nitrososphaerota archaeon]